MVTVTVVNYSVGTTERVLVTVIGKYKCDIVSPC
jgi:hypothetical protein